MKRIWLRTTIRMLSGIVFGLVTTVAWMGDRPGVADAQVTSPTLIAGEPKRGTISRSGETVSYIFHGSGGQVVTIRMNKRSSSLDPYLELYIIAQSQDRRIAQDDDSGGDANSLIANFRLPSTAMYKVKARGYNSSSTGEFELILSESSRCGGTIQFGQPVTNQSLSPGQECTFTFAAVYSAAVDIKMEKQSGDLDPLLELYDPSGSPVPVAKDDDSAGDHDAQISNYVLLSKKGTYTIVARSYGSGQSGSFRLTLWAW